MEIKRLKQEAKELLFKDGQKQILEFLKIGILKTIPFVLVWIILSIVGVSVGILFKEYHPENDALNSAAGYAMLSNILLIFVLFIIVLFVELILTFLSQRMFLKLVNEEKFTSIKETLSELSTNVFFYDFLFSIVIGVVVGFIEFIFNFIPIISFFINIYVSLTVSFMMYQRYSNKNVGLEETVKTGYMVANGRQWTLLKLGISFIPWVIVGFITFGIGFIWITPYMQTTYALFFKKALEIEKANPSNNLTPSFMGKKIYKDETL